MSIRLRLTLLYSAILAVTLIAFGVVLYSVVAQVTLSAAQDRLKADAPSLVADLQLYNAPFGQSPPSPVDTGDTFVEIRNLDGSIAIQSPNLEASKLSLPLDQSWLAKIQAGAPAPPSPPSVVTVGGQQYLLYTDIVVSHDRGVVGILQVARPMSVIDQPLDVVRRVLLIGGGIVTLLAFGAGWLLAGTALRPINRLTQTAREIGAAQDFERRVDYAGPADEVGRLASTFNAMLTSLHAAYQAQRRFVGDASHELRTPLTSIRGNLGLLQRQPPIAEADRVAVLADLVAETERLSRLVADLLTLARSDAGRPLRHEPVPLRPLVADLVRRLAAAKPGRTVEMEGPTEATALGDPDALTQVLLILLDNALKFTPPDGTVAVSIAVHEADVSIAVRDTGPGIAPEALPHIFERFYQGDAARTGSGAGLGLAIAQALMEGQGGTLRVTSVQGQGSTFTVTLPRAAVAQPVLS